MSRSLIALALLTFAGAAAAAPAPLLPARLGGASQVQKVNPGALAKPEVWREFGLVARESARYSNRGVVTAYQLQDVTGAFAAWEWLRSVDDHRCNLTELCAANTAGTLTSTANYVVYFQGFTPTPEEVKALYAGLPSLHDGAPPPLLAFVPRAHLVPNSSRYVLGPEGLQAVAPELTEAHPGFDQGAEAHFTTYQIEGRPIRLCLFYYPSPEMARLHTIGFKLIPGTLVKRSGVLVAIVLPGATDKQAEAVLSQIEYQAKITWNEKAAANPIPELYRLLLNIVIVSVILAALALAAGLMYAGMRIYRRRYGNLEEQEAMTTLHLGS